LDELDLNLASLAASLLIIVIIIVSRGGNSRTLGAAGFAVAGRVITRRAVIELRRISDVGHFDGLDFVLDRVG
jgi:hypothetical protein